MSVAVAEKTEIKHPKPGGCVRVNKAGPGRPKGLKNKMTLLKQYYLDGAELAAKARGKAGVAEWLAEVATDSPAKYAQILASLLPKEQKIDLVQRSSDAFGDELRAMSDEELARLGRVVE